MFRKMKRTMAKHSSLFFQKKFDLMYFSKIVLLIFIARKLLIPEIFAQSYPEFSCTVFDTSTSGYYFLVPIRVGSGGPVQNPTQMILDRNGNVVYTKEFASGNTGDFKLQPNGLISYSFQNKFYLMDSTFTIVDSVRIKNGFIQDGHDMQILPNGHFLLLGWENITMDLSSYAIFNNNGTVGSANATVRCGIVQEQDANKNVVFEWHSKDYFNFTEVDTMRLLNPANVDWTHFNAVELDDDGNILVSVRHFNEITKVNRSTGAVMWRLGGKMNQFTFTNDSTQFIGQHDIRRIANGNITILDNGRPGPPVHPVRAKEYSLDENNLIATLVWSHTSDSLISSEAIGNVQRLSNGNTLINYGMVDNLPQVFNVVNSAGGKVFELAFTDSLRSYRVFNYETLPWALNRPEISCVDSNGIFFLDAGSGHSSYLWSNGETTQLIQVNDTGLYSVFVPRGEGGFICSETFSVNNLSDPCNLISVLIKDNLNFENSIYPNPFTSEIYFKGNSEPEYFELLNSIGVVVWSGTELKDQDFSSLFPGMYFLKIISNKNSVIVKLLKL